MAEDKRANVVRPDFAKRERARASGDARRSFVEALYRQHFAEVCRVLRKVFGEGPPEPEELAQQAFETIASLPDHDRIENPRAFLFRVAINAGYRSVRRTRLFDRYAAEQKARPDLDLEEITPERLYLDREKVRALDRAMASLSPKQREIVVRARFYGQTYAEIAALKGWSQADISRQLNTALKRLADAIQLADDGKES